MDLSAFEPVIVTTTSDQRDVLETISKTLLEKHLAVCVQISGPISSQFSWQNKIAKAEEWQCVIKSAKQLLEKLENVVLAVHNYDQPQLVAVDIVAGSESYLQWMAEYLADE